MIVGFDFDYDYYRFVHRSSLVDCDCIAFAAVAVNGVDDRVTTSTRSDRSRVHDRVSRRECAGYDYDCAAAAACCPNRSSLLLPLPRQSLLCPRSRTTRSDRTAWTTCCRCCCCCCWICRCLLTARRRCDWTTTTRRLVLVRPTCVSHESDSDAADYDADGDCCCCCCCCCCCFRQSCSHGWPTWTCADDCDDGENSNENENADDDD